MTPEEKKAEFNKLAPVAINDVAGLIDGNFAEFQKAQEDYRSQLPVGDPRMLEPALIPADFLSEEGMKQRGLLDEKGEATKLGEDYLLMEDEGFMRGGQLTEKGKAYTADPDELLPVDEVNDWTLLTNSFDVDKNGKFSDPSVESKYQQFQIRKSEGLDKAEGGNVFKQLGEGLLSFGRGVYNVTPLPTMKKVVTGEGISPSEEITKRVAVLSGALNIMGNTATKSIAFVGQPILSEDENDRNDFIVATRVKMNRLATEPEALDAITGTSVMADAYAKTLEGYKERFGEAGESKLQQDLLDAKIAGQIAGDPLNPVLALATGGVALLGKAAMLSRVSKSVNAANIAATQISRLEKAAPIIRQQLNEATVLNQTLIKQLDDAVKVGDSATVAKLTPAVANSTKAVDDLARKVVGLEEGLAVNTAGRTKALTELAEKSKPLDLSRKATSAMVKSVEVSAEKLGNAAAFTNRALRAAEKTIGFYGTGRIVTTALGIGTGPVGQTALGTYYTARVGLSVAPIILRKTARFANVVGDELVQMKNSTPFWRRVAANENVGGIGKAMATTLDYASPAARLAVGSVKQGAKLAPALAVYEAINNGGLDDEAMKRVGANALVFGAFARVVGGGKQDLAKRQSGDFYNYRSKQQKLGEDKLAAFDAIPDQPLKQFISTYDSAYPNTWDWQFTREGNSSFDPASKTITVNVNDKAGFVRALTAHETLHSLTFKHGMDDSIVAKMLGDETRPGLVRDINGNLDKDFKQFYDTYNERLDAQGLPRIGIEDAAVEFFTDNGTAALFDDVVSGKLTKAAVKTPLRRKIEDIFETVFAATPIVKDLHYKLGGATDVNGNLVMGSGLLVDGMKELPEVKAMVRKMYRESAGLPKSPIKPGLTDDLPSSNPKHYKAGKIIDEINKKNVKDGKPLIEGVMIPDKNGNGTGLLSDEHFQALEEAGVIKEGGAQELILIQSAFDADKAALLDYTPIEQGRSVQTAGKTANKVKPIDFMVKNGRLYMVGMDIVQLGLNIKRFERRAAAMGMSRANVLTDIVETAKLHKRGASTDGYFKSVGGKNWKQRQNLIKEVQVLNTKAQRVTNPMFDKLGMNKQTGTYRTFAYDRIDGFTDLTGDMVIPYGNNAYYTLKANLMPQAPRINVKGEIVKDAPNVRLMPEGQPKLQPTSRPAKKIAKSFPDESPTNDKFLSLTQEGKKFFKDKINKPIPGSILGTVRFMPENKRIMDNFPVDNAVKSAMEGKVGFAFVSDWADSNRPYVTRNGRDVDVLTGGVGYTYHPEVIGKGGWAGSFSALTNRVLKKINQTDGIGLVVAGGRESTASSRSFSLAFMEELRDDLTNKTISKSALDNIIRNNAKQILGRKDIQSFSDYNKLLKIENNYDGLTFEQRADMIKKIGSDSNKKAFGILNWNDVIKKYEMQNGDFQSGQIMSVVQFKKDAPLVRASEIGIKEHKSYEAVIQGKPLGMLTEKVMISDFFKDFFDAEGTQATSYTRKVQTKMPNFKYGEGSAVFSKSLTKSISDLANMK